MQTNTPAGLASVIEPANQNKQDIDIIDGKVNLTKLTQSQNKNIKEWLKNKNTTAFLKALQVARGNSPQLEIINGVGTFGTQEVAIRLAQWISPEFEVYCIDKLKTLFNTGKVEITKPKTTLELLQLAVTELEAKEKEILKLQHTVANQNNTNLELLELTALNTKTGIKALKNDIGNEINSIVYQLYSETCESNFRLMHKTAQAEYNRQSTIAYLGAKTTSIQSKNEYVNWLRRKKLKLALGLTNQEDHGLKQNLIN
jgi:KilA-N domain